ncbi:MAG: ABC transporter ATP-binding protein [Clostridiales bacterium]|nr:ABC transporter ATP-binding protein [Clostridiales bacterium]
MELSRENIHKTVEELGEFLDQSSIDSKRCLHLKLLIEAIILDHLASEKAVSFAVDSIRKKKKVCIDLKIDGDPFNDLEKPRSVIVKNLLENTDIAPKWHLRGDQNIYHFEEDAIVPEKNSLIYILRYMAKKKKAFVFASVLRLVNMVLTTIEPILSAYIITAYAASDITKIFMLAALILGQAIASGLITYFSSRLLRESYSSMAKDMRRSIVSNVLMIKTECMDRNSSGVFTQRLLSEVDNMTDDLDELLTDLTEVFRFVSLMIAFAIVSWQMMLFEIALFAIYALIQRAQTRSIARDDRKVRSVNEKMAGFTSEMVRAHRDIKLLHAEDSFMSKMKGGIDESVGLVNHMRIRSMKYILLRSEYVGFTDFIYMSILALQLSFGIITPATALVLYNYNGRAYVSARSITGIMDTYYGLLLSSERVYQLLESPDFAKESFGKEKIHDARGEISLKNVYFSYLHENGRSVEVLKGVDLTVNAGEKVAFVGRSGCGKSTLLSLITRLYDPDSGSVMLDGVDLRRLDKDTVRGNIAMVGQSPYIFNMSIRDNMNIVKEDLTDEDLNRVFRMACIYDDFQTYPQGYDTVIGESGITLSGGQRQRLALARVLLKDYPVIILDEATSALDNLTQSSIMDTIGNISGDRTIIMVAHRLSTVKDCDRIFFMDKGKILASGTHSELMEKCKEYRELYCEETQDHPAQK